VVAALLEKDPDSLVSTAEVYNEVARLKKVRLNGLTPMEALITELLDDEDWAIWYTTDDIGHVNFLFFAHDEAIDLAQENPDVILIDATYRTNRYKCLYYTLWLLPPLVEPPALPCVSFPPRMRLHTERQFKPLRIW